MALFTWSEKYFVGVKEMDNQHSVLVGILNELHAAMMEGQAKSVTGPLLNKLLEYTRYHFASEEKILAATKYPLLMQQSIMHQKLTKRVVEFAERYERGEKNLSLDLMSFLRDWLSTHILKEDHQYGPWMNEHGVR